MCNLSLQLSLYVSLDIVFTMPNLDIRKEPALSCNESPASQTSVGDNRETGEFQLI